MMRFLTVLLYFLLAILIFASVGVSVPYYLDSMNDNEGILKNLNQNLVTYYVAILITSCLDILIKLFDRNVVYKKVAFLGISLLVAIIVGITIYVLYQNYTGQIAGLSKLVIFCLIVSFIMWWVANYKNSNFNISSVIGGDANKELKNG